MKRDDFNKWLARLRDPNSKQHIGGGCLRPCNAYVPANAVPADSPMCCLVHGQHAVEGTAFIQGHDDKKEGSYWGWADKHIPGMALKLADMNDSGDYTLPMIADWLEKNVTVED